MKNISKIEELLLIERNDHVAITDDIDCNGMHLANIMPIFSGIIEGNGHSISNITVSVDVWGDEQKIALFQYISRATIKNLVFENINFIIDIGPYTPSISALGVGVTDSIIENVSISVYTSSGQSIPLLYEVAGCTLNNINYVCNNKCSKMIKYKEGSLL